ncbi:MAG: hypothetical protein C3F12_01680 [Candidatus Methylomirabilota bacterium]|nr:cbb3-type cytochrome c oxidase subunit I [candidate division NC10 bacterium]PWB48499.1 MAG: hypothetical protein C3F12_01680 [candidate division NC10 bacterium]
MADTTGQLTHPAHRDSAADRIAKRVMWLYIGSGLTLVGVMIVVGLGMRMAQGGFHQFDAGLFYKLMTLHGAAMMVGMALCGMGLLWYLFTQDASLSPTTAIIACALILIGAVLVAVSVMVGGFAAAWTFLYPLPFVGTFWPSWATGVFLAGIACVVLGWTLWCLQMLGGALTRYGGLRGALAWDLVWSPSKFAESGRTPPPPQAFAVIVAAVDGLLAGSAGMLVGVALFVRWLDPTLALDPLWVKNLTYIFGHTLANLTIYMPLAAVYVALPRYTHHRHWHTSAVLAVAWWATLAFVAIAYFHHLYMDFAQPRPVQYIGQAASYLAAFPPAVVTIFGGALLVYRSGFRWTLGSMFLYVGMIGWMVGGVGALLDATVAFNIFFHNTLWVVAHFHTYLLEGAFLFVLGWIFHCLEERSGAVSSPAVRTLVGLGIFGGGAWLVLGWYLAGAQGVPRRYAVQPAPGTDIGWWASLGGIILVVGLILCAIEAIRLARRPARREVSAA